MVLLLWVIKLFTQIKLTMFNEAEACPFKLFLLFRGKKSMMLKTDDIYQLCFLILSQSILFGIKETAIIPLSPARKLIIVTVTGVIFFCYLWIRTRTLFIHALSFGLEFKLFNFPDLLPRMIILIFSLFWLELFFSP